MSTPTPFRVRASSWPEIFDCAHRFEGKHILGLTKPSGLRAQLGTAIHAGTAAYDAARMEGNSISPDDAAGFLVDTLRKPGQEVDYSQDDITLDDAERIGLILHTRYCTEISPKFEFIAVERTIDPFDIDCGNGIVVRLTGTMDRSRIRKSTNGKGIIDLKSGGAAVEKGHAKTKGHAPQIGVYEILEAASTGEPCTEPAEIIGLKTRGKPEVATGEIRGATAMMVGTEDSPGLIEYAAEMFRSGLFPPNPASLLCSKRYCPRFEKCRFKND
jgi:hypothetical protein